MWFNAQSVTQYKCVLLHIRKRDIVFYVVVIWLDSCDFSELIIIILFYFAIAYDFLFEYATILGSLCPYVFQHSKELTNNFICALYYYYPASSATMRVANLYPALPDLVSYLLCFNCQSFAILRLWGLPWWPCLLLHRIGVHSSTSLSCSPSTVYVFLSIVRYSAFSS